MSVRRLILLGSTGSIGQSTLAVVEHLRTLGVRFEVAGLAAGSRADEVFAQADRFDVRHLAIAGGDDAPRADERRAGGRTVHRGPDAALRLVESIARPGDLVVGAMVGAAGLSPTIAAIERGCDIALANKETLVAAGALVMPLARRHGVRILPVDSEHSAIFQCLRGGGDREVRRLVITASGGPFRTWDAARMHAATVAEALNHPTWRMGPKVTIDSASMMNKALEMIEASWLFDVDEPRIEPLIHPQSIVHSFVEFVDGSVIAQLSPPDMKLPIQYALTFPARVDGCSPMVDWTTLRSLEFERVDVAKFPAVRLARRALRAGGTSGAILNAANEVAVEAFLDGRIRFGRIPELVEQAMDAVPPADVHTLADVRTADADAREAARGAIAVTVP
ncbi:MAG: 1-deoxy-D-xylulose-5-phosphate reductoisomerase [Phycisphaerales bacterium]